MFVAEVIHLIYNNSATEDESAALFCFVCCYPFVLHVAGHSNKLYSNKLNV